MERDRTTPLSSQGRRRQHGIGLCVRLGDAVEPAAIVLSEKIPIVVSADAGAGIDGHTTVGIGAKPRTVAPSLLWYEIEAVRIPLVELEDSEVDVERERPCEGFGIARPLCAIST